MRHDFEPSYSHSPARDRAGDHAYVHVEEDFHQVGAGRSTEMGISIERVIRCESKLARSPRIALPRLNIGTHRFVVGPERM
jgi:hypothetical protein